MMAIEIPIDSELDKAAERFLAAAHAYSEAMKRHCPAERGGIIWLKRNHEAVLFSTVSRYSDQLATMTFDRIKDEIVFCEMADDDEREEQKEMAGR